MNVTQLMGMKDLYQVTLRATYDMTIGDRKVVKGEPVTSFERIQFGNIRELKEHHNATGGYGNQVWVSWDRTKEVEFNFTQGIFSITDLALLGNSHMDEEIIVTVPMVEELEIGENGLVELNHVPNKNSLFLYTEDGKRVNSFTTNEKTVETQLAEFAPVKAIYDFNYHGKNQSITVGHQLINGYLELTGKTRLRDEDTGRQVTVIIKIPKLKLMSDLSITLGKDVPPVVAAFQTIGYPVGSKGNERTMELIVLDEDIDSEF